MQEEISEQACHRRLAIQRALDFSWEQTLKNTIEEFEKTMSGFQK